jgi:hypothetical protein
MVTSEKFWQRNLHKFVGMMRGRMNTCQTQRNDGSFSQKVDYKSQATAAKSALRLTEKWHKEFDAYQCWYCNGWHIGGAARLTFGKFWSIMWVWLFGSKRTVRKARMKVRGFEKVQKCDRCGKDTNTKIMSMYNTAEICMECKDAEKQRPDYKDAVKAEEAAIKSGDFNFKGIGLK